MYAIVKAEIIQDSWKWLPPLVSRRASEAPKVTHIHVWGQVSHQMPENANVFMLGMRLWLGDKFRPVAEFQHNNASILFTMAPGLTLMAYEKPSFRYMKYVLATPNFVFQHDGYCRSNFLKQK